MGKRDEVIVREALDADREAIRQVMLDAYEEYAAVIPSSLWTAYRASISEAVEGGEPTDRLVAEDGGRIIGSALLYLGSESAYGRADLGIYGPIIRYISVLPSARGRGAATSLLREGAARSLARGHNSLHLHTSDMMASAVRLYERLGFERAYDKEFHNGSTLVKSYRIYLPGNPFVLGGAGQAIQREVR